MRRVKKIRWETRPQRAVGFAKANKKTWTLQNTSCLAQLTWTNTTTNVAVRTTAWVQWEAAEAEAAAALQEDHEVPLSLKAGGALSGHLIQLRGVGFGYPGSTAPLFNGAEFSIDSKSRIVLLGENGNGKTTLVQLLLGDCTGKVAATGEDLEACFWL